MVGAILGLLAGDSLLSRAPRSSSRRALSGRRLHSRAVTVSVFLCFCVSVILRYLWLVRNLTVSVPDEVYRQARIRAAEQGRSVSALVAEFLATLRQDAEEFERLLAQQNRVLEEIESFSAGDRVGRDELHHRAAR